MRILDLDNCISDDGWRVKYIDWNRSGDAIFHEYHSLAPWDDYANRFLVDGAKETDESITIITSRPILYRPATIEWLRRNGIGWRHLIMRNNGDHRPSTKLKRTQLEWLLEHYDVPLRSISIAYDDRPDIVDMYRSFGIRAEVRSIHNNLNYGPNGYQSA